MSDGPDTEGGFDTDDWSRLAAFTGRVATSVVEVRDGRAVVYPGKYADYLDRVEKEVEAGEREQAARLAKTPAAAVAKASPRPARRDEKAVRKELKALEKTIAQLDDQRRAANAKLMETTDAAEAVRLHDEVAALTAKLDPAEERWLALQEELGGS